MVQKYLGQLLTTQRHERELTLFPKKNDMQAPFTEEKLKEFLARELQDNKVLRTAHLSRSFDRVLKIDPCPH